jgi:hypothetical protein
MPRSQLLPAAIALAALLTATAACDVSVGEGGFSMDLARANAKDTWTRSYTLEPGGRLELINVNGRINATPADGETVELVAERTAKGSTDEAAKALLEKIEMREEVGPARVRVEVRAPRSFGMGGHEIVWTIKVPRGAVVDLRTTNGRVNVKGLSGEVHASTVNGGVEGEALDASNVEASTVNGGVRVELTKALPADGSVSLEAVNGGVSLSLPADSRATINARVTNGGINTTGLNLELTGEQNRRRLEGTLNGGGARVSLETTNGGVRLSNAMSAEGDPKGSPPQ